MYIAVKAISLFGANFFRSDLKNIYMNLKNIYMNLKIFICTICRMYFGKSWNSNFKKY